MELMEFKELLFSKAKEEGFTKYEIYYANKDETSIQVSGEEVEECGISTSRGLSFRGIINGKLGYSYTEKLHKDSIEILLTNAKECAEFAEGNGEGFIYDGKGDYTDVITYDESFNTLKVDEQIQMAITLEQKVKNISGEIYRVAGSSVKATIEEVSIINSEGLNLNSKQSLIKCGVIPIVREFDNMITDSEDVKHIYLNDVNIDEIAKSAVTKVLSKKGANPMKSGKYKILMNNEVMGAFLNVMKSNFYGDVAEDEKSLFGDRVGKLIASPMVDLIDNPILEKGISSRRFDDEGVPTQSKYIIKNGIFIGFMHNLKTAKKLGLKSTGNGFKSSFTSPIKVSSTNFYIEPKDLSFERLLLYVDYGLYITDLDGIHSGVDLVTGDFSLSAQGILVENGKLTRAVKQITIAGNFMDILKDIEMVGDDLKFNPYSTGVGSPSVVIRSLSVAGDN